jgi:glycyl-tRNA synthetase beta subunit
VRIIRAAQIDHGPHLHLRQVQALTIDNRRFIESAERDLYQAIQSSVVHSPSSVDELLNIIVKLLPSINAFFDKVLVMAEDEQLRQNRLALVGKIANLSNGIADLSKLEGF